MGFWLKAPVVIGPLVMIMAHLLRAQGLDDLFGMGAVMAVVGMFCLRDLVSSDEVHDAILHERERCEAKFQKYAERRRSFERGEITFGEWCGPHSP